MKSLFRRHFSIIPMALLLTGCPALRHSSPAVPQLWAPGDESLERLNKFANEYNLYVNRLHLGQPRDLKLWKQIQHDWEQLQKGSN